jgi:hypothetical protein
MIRIYEVKTETSDGLAYGSYRVAAKTFESAVAKVTKKEIQPFDTGERIAAVHVLASEGR